MEQWQKDLIVRNITQLMQLTTCSFTLLAKLLSCNILSEHDVEELVGLSQTRPEQVYKFYSILKTRENSFEELLCALQATNQTGALGLLNKERNMTGQCDITTVTYDTTTILGKGNLWTVVYRGTFCDRDVAVKRVLTDMLEMSQAVREINVLKTCDMHENIVRYFGSKQDQHYTLIVLELCDATLIDWIGNKVINIFPIEILRQATTGLEWLHDHLIVHRDLKPENILLTASPPRVKISDFGLSKRLVENKPQASSWTPRGTPGWMAPEVLAQEYLGHNTSSAFTFASDVFALGCIFYYVITEGKHSFGDRIRCQANIVDGKTLMERRHVLHGCSDNVVFIELMISQNQSARPSCSDILTWPLFWSKSTCIRFLEHLINDNYGSLDEYFDCLICETSCLMDHSTELELLTTSGYRRLEAQACVVPATYLKFKGRNADNSELPLDRNNFVVDNLATEKEKPWEPSTDTTRGSSQGVKTLMRIVETPEAMSFNDSMNFGMTQYQPFVSDSKIIKILEELNKLKYDQQVEQLFNLVKDEPVAVIERVLEDVKDKLNIKEMWDEEKQTLLHHAVKYREYAVVEYLVKNQNFSNELSKEKFKNSLVHACIDDIDDMELETYEEKIKSLKLLFEYQPKLVDSRDVAKRTPLHYAILFVFEFENQWDYIQMLVKNNADVNMKDSFGSTPLHLTVADKYLPDNFMNVIKLLIEHNADPEATDDRGCTMLQLAAFNIPPSLFQELTIYLSSIGKAKGFENLDIKGFTQFELLQEALSVFKSNGLDFNSVDHYCGDSVLFDAIACGRQEYFLETMGNFGSDYSILNDDKENVLHYAAENWNLSALKFFIRLGCNVNAKSKKGDTPLHQVLQKRRAQNAHEIISELLHHGANVNVKDRNGILPIDLAKTLLKNRKIQQKTVDMIKKASTPVIQKKIAAILSKMF